MFNLKGQIVGVTSKTIATGERQGQSYPVYQIMHGSDNFKRLETVKDFQGLIRGKMGDEFNHPVAVSSFAFRNGSTGLDIRTIKVS